ncbi:KTSC domain-containing protein [Streptomyces cacaoi]|uniref:KTSC domain-containing protein n=1 Tax=Streptomyces cacaoi TaxID=1898 RepID=UPI0037484A74
MLRQSVSSSNLRSVGYDPANGVLEVEFKSGAVYQYSGVPEGIHSALISAGSKGQYLHRAVIGTFPCQRISRL